MDKKKYLNIAIIFICIISITLIGTYALKLWTSTNNTELTFRIGEYSTEGITCKNGEDITISNIGPIFDYNIDGEIVNFKVISSSINTEPLNVSFNVSSITDNLKEESFKYILLSSIDNNTFTEETKGNFSNVSNGTSLELIKDKVITKTTYYKLIIYIDGNMENPISMQNGSITGNLEMCIEKASNLDTSGANTPDLVDGLIPVMYDGSKWVKADSTNTTSTYQWYDYNNKSWANAVLVTETNRNTYLNSSPGTEITESDILAYYVWIPRYKYKVWNINKVVGTDSYDAYHTGIDIVFENDKESTGTISCTYSYATPSSSAGSPNETCTGSNGDYYTHPAFTFGSDEVRGFWIGKFEISSSNPATGSSYGGGETTSLTIRILPNVTSWRYNTVSNYNTVIQNMQAISNIYGLNTSRTNTDSHMLTNYEWGAVAYLTNSKYGRCTDGSCTEVTKNGYGETNNFTTMTGCGPISSGSTSYSTTCNAYNTTLGQLASTTGNVTGVYDMSGGAFEYIMGNMSSVSGSYTFYPSEGGFANSWYTASRIKYITTYANGSSNGDQTAYNRGRLGDATGEVVLSTGEFGSWYSGYSDFPFSDYSWFVRGGIFYNGTSTSILGFSHNPGDSFGIYSSRAALISLSS